MGLLMWFLRKEETYGIRIFRGHMFCCCKFFVSIIYPSCGNEILGRIYVSIKFLLLELIYSNQKDEGINWISIHFSYLVRTDIFRIFASIHRDKLNKNLMKYEIILISQDERLSLGLNWSKNRARAFLHYSPCVSNL